VRRYIFLALMTLNLNVLARSPDLIGLATWYHPCSHLIHSAERVRCESQMHLMANGEKFDASALTMAVDRSRKDLLERQAIVLTECGRLLRVRLTDTGLLQAAGIFRKGLKRSCSEEDCIEVLRYWPEGRDDVLWLSELKYAIVADFPQETFRSLVSCGAGELETTVVAIWILP